jgi:hypothetical protein
VRRLQGGSREILPTQRLCSIGTKRVRHAMVYCQSLIDCTRDRYHERFLSTCNFPTNTLHSSLLDKLQRNLDEMLEFFPLFHKALTGDALWDTLERFSRLSCDNSANIF